MHVCCKRDCCVADSFNSCVVISAAVKAMEAHDSNKSAEFGLRWYGEDTLPCMSEGTERTPIGGVEERKALAGMHTTVSLA